MSQLYLLDTNAASAILRQREPVCRRAAMVPLSSLAISSVTAAELHYGLAKRPLASTLAALVHEFLRYVDIVPWSDATAPHYGALRAALEAKGITIAPLDLMIAAHALALGATLVSADQALSMIDGLTIEDWCV
ncbi:MAG: type II toxin-antitoxin system VapC family toxin [Sphingomonadaceae bacterium]